VAASSRRARFSLYWVVFRRSSGPADRCRPIGATRKAFGPDRCHPKGVPRAALKRQLLDLPAKGPAATRSQEPQAAPETLKKSPAPLFHAASRKIRREIYEGYKYFLAAFRDAAARLRAGEPGVAFPPGSFPPAAPWVAG